MTAHRSPLTAHFFALTALCCLLSACTSTTYVSDAQGTRITRSSILTKQGPARVKVTSGETTVTIEVGTTDQTGVATALVPAAAQALAK